MLQRKQGPALGGMFSSPCRDAMLASLLRATIAANGPENVPDIQMATAAPPGTNINMNVICGRHAPQHSLDFFVSFFIKKKRKRKELS